MAVTVVLLVFLPDPEFCYRVSEYAILVNQIFDIPLGSNLTYLKYPMPSNC